MNTTEELRLMRAAIRMAMLTLQAAERSLDDVLAERIISQSKRDSLLQNINDALKVSASNLLEYTQ